jgi:hypothetical protein
MQKRKHLRRPLKLWKMSEDLIVTRVKNRFDERSAIGIKKYGTTLENNNKDDYLKHLQEELMDAVLYIEKLRFQNENKNKNQDKGEDQKAHYY